MNFRSDGKCVVWRKRHIAVDKDTHVVIAAELSLSSVTDAKVRTSLLKQARRKITEISGDRAYGTKDGYEVICRKRADALIPPRDEAF
ncbi:TPA: transposase [Vibrio vulnificus]|nr:transposase [Vibrio vulnificus]